MNYREIGQRVRALRKQRHITQAEMAEQLEISTSFLGHIERGTRILSLETLAKIAKLFVVPVDYLIFGEQVDIEPITKKDRTLRDMMRMLDRYYDEWAGS